MPDNIKPAIQLTKRPPLKSKHSAKSQSSWKTLSHWLTLIQRIQTRGWTKYLYGYLSSPFFVRYQNRYNGAKYRCSSWQRWHMNEGKLERKLTSQRRVETLFGPGKRTKHGTLPFHGHFVFIVRHRDLSLENCLTIYWLWQNHCISILAVSWAVYRLLYRDVPRDSHPKFKLFFPSPLQSLDALANPMPREGPAPWQRLWLMESFTEASWLHPLPAWDSPSLPRRS